MTTWQKITTFLKSYWWIPVGIILAVAVYIITLGKGDFVSKLLNNALDSYQRQTDTINSLQKQKDEEKAALEEKYKAVLKKLEDEYAKQQKQLEEDKKQYAKELVKKYKDDDVALSEEFAKEFGIKIGN